VLWLPVFLAVLGIVVDGTIMFTNRSMAMKVVQDANRSFAIGRLTTPVETQDYILTRLRPMSPSVTAQTSVDKGVILTRVTMPAEEIDAIGLFGLLTGFKVGFQAQHMAEN
jgi:Flp pilus assembly protein TadG